ncbi:MAG TPA: alpha/beta fold hydrolase [Gaiellaceae bacterium]|jgi:pimeloyl-ACP methyl ester carboxylesterase
MRQDGRAVMLVHGLSGSSRWWREVELRAWDVRAVDLPRRLPPARAPAWLGERLDEPAVVVGHSLGGLVAAQLAAERPELVTALVLVAPVGAPRPLTGYAAGLVRTLREARWPLVGAVAADAVRTGLPALARGAWFATRSVFAGAIGVPTLLVWGERDRLVPPELAPVWQAAIPHARLALVEGAGHVPMLEAPSRFGQILQEFLDGLGDHLRP